MDPADEFQLQKAKSIRSQGKDAELSQLSLNWMLMSSRHSYTYNFTWLGRPIIQFPQDVLAMQEIIWRVKPEVIIETGIAHGGSLIFYASMLELVGNSGIVLGIDVDIREHNRVEIENHRLAHRIMMIEGSSIDRVVANQVRELACLRKSVMVVLDSNHTHGHVLSELQLYSGLVSRDSYLVVMDTTIEDAPDDFFPNRPWSRGNSPKSAVVEFLRSNDRFVVDKSIDDKLLITVARDGYLKCIKD